MRATQRIDRHHFEGRLALLANAWAQAVMQDDSFSHKALSGRLPGAGAASAAPKDNAKLIAFYLPQFHRIPENSAWWGPGFTEWTNVAKARPNFEGHHQPQIPRELGFYDLSSTAVLREQAELARLAGLSGFCFYHYWFSGRRILETPVNNFLASDISFPFCACWANENWTRTWQGDEKSVLLEQHYEENDEERLIESLAPLFRDARYIKVSEKPLFVVYRIKELPNPTQSIQKWRNAASRLGFPGLHIAVVDFYDITDPREVGADALVEVPPHKFNGAENSPTQPPAVTNPSFQGRFVDYRSVIAQSAAREVPPYTLYRGAMPGWDNTARRQDTPLTVVNSSPALFGAWLRYLRAWTSITRASCPDPFLFINAWNEWGEGCHLEPDLRDGLGSIEECGRSEWVAALDPVATVDEARARLDREVAVACRASAIELPESLLRYRGRSPLVHAISRLLRPFTFIHRPARSVYQRLRAARG
jgi:lipopolysaccharide biosynthesis protein